MVTHKTGYKQNRALRAVGSPKQDGPSIVGKGHEEGVVQCGTRHQCGGDLHSL